MEPDRLGKYEIQGTLGKGAMGTVYGAWDPIISRKVAIKTVRLPDASDLEAQEELARFKREAQAAGRLTHPNIVGIFDYGETAELAYIVMEYVDGHTLKSLLDADERLPVTTVSRVMTDLLAGLQYSHERGVVHRDIKPANIMMVGSSGQAKIADFGIARIESSNLTQAGTIMGTPAYMSPEQFTGQTVDSRTDIYSSGVLLFQLLTGDRPFEGSMATIMHKALNTQPPKPSDLSVTAPRALDAVVARAMARRPEDRYDTASDFAEAVKAAIEGRAPPPAADPFDGDATVVRPVGKPVAPAPAPTPTRRRNKTPMLAGAAIVVLGAAGAGAWFALSGPGPAPTPSPALTQQLGTPPSGVVAVTPPTIVQTPLQEARAPEPLSPGVNSTPVPPTPTPPDPIPTVTQVVPATTERPVSNAQAAPPASTPAPTRSPGADVPRLEPAQIMPPPSPALAPAPLTATSPVPSLPSPTVPDATAVRPAPPAPAVLAAAGMSGEAMRRAVTNAVQSAECSTVRGELTRSGTVSLQGVIGSGAPVQSLLRQMQDAAPNAPLDWMVAEADGPYCGVLDTIRPYARPFGTMSGGVELALKDERTRLLADDNIDIRATTPAFPSYLQIDYFSNDGSVAHVRDAMAGTAPLAARSAQSMVAGAVAPPFGTDLIVVVASSTPLFTKGQVLPEDAKAYTRELRRAIEVAKARRSELSASAMVVHTAPKS